MSTNALVVFKNDDKTYDGISVQFDGYIEGVGRTLYFNWRCPKDVEKLCKENKEVRCLGRDFEETEFYPVRKFSRQYIKRFKGMDFYSLLNESGNFDFTYVYNKGTWWELKKDGERVDMDVYFMDERLAMEDEEKEE